jgi:hypothetical protein
VAYLVNITARAERDLAALYDEIDAENSGAARRWYSGLKQAILRLEDQPYCWPVTYESPRLRHLPSSSSSSPPLAPPAPAPPPATCDRSLFRYGWKVPMRQFSHKSKRMHDIVIRWLKNRKFLWVTTERNSKRVEVVRNVEHDPFVNPTLIVNVIRNRTSNCWETLEVGELLLYYHNVVYMMARVRAVLPQRRHSGFELLFQSLRTSGLIRLDYFTRNAQFWQVRPSLWLNNGTVLGEWFGDVPLLRVLEGKVKSLVMILLVMRRLASGRAVLALSVEICRPI